MAKLKSVTENTNIAAPTKSYLKLVDTKLERGTNILDIEIPEELEVKIETGISWFDAITGGDEPGLTPSSVTLLTGMPGGGKTTLALQMADSLTAQGATVLYNSGEESRYQVRKVARRLELDVGFTFGEDTLVGDIIEHGKMLRAKNPGKPLVLILDSLATLDDGKYGNGHINANSAVRVMKMLVEFAKERPFATIIVIGQVTKSGDFAGKCEMKHALDCHVHIHFDTDKKSETFGKRIMNYSKNRFGPISANGTVLDITPKGLVALEGYDTECPLGS